MCVLYIINYILSLAGLGMQSINSYIEHINNRDILDKQVFRVKKLMGRRWDAPNSNYLLAMGWPGTFIMPFSITLNASHTHIKQTHTCIHRHTQTCTDTPTHIIQTQTYTRTHTSHRHTHNMCCVCVCVCVCVCTWQSTNLYMITPCNG